MLTQFLNKNVKLHQTPHAYSVLIQATCCRCVCKNAIGQQGFVSLLGDKATADLDLGKSRVLQAGAGFDHAKELEACSAFGVTACVLTSLQANEESVSALCQHHLVMPPATSKAEKSCSLFLGSYRR